MKSKLDMTDAEIVAELRLLALIAETEKKLRCPRWNINGRIEEGPGVSLKTDSKTMYENILRSRYLQRFPQTPWHLNRFGEIEFDNDDDDVHFRLVMI